MKTIKMPFANFIVTPLILVLLLVPFVAQAQPKLKDKKSDQFTAQHLADVLPFFVIASDMEISSDEPWAIVLPDRTANETSSTSGVVRLYNQLPDDRKKKGVVLFNSLTHLENIPLGKKAMTAFQVKMYEDGDWLKAKKAAVAELVQACDKAQVDLWVNTNLGGGEIHFIRLTQRHPDQPSMSPALLGALRKSGLPAGAKSLTLPLKSTFFGFMVEMQIDGKPVQLVLDMGASFLILSPEKALKLGLQPTEVSLKLGTAAGGKVASQRALTRRISIGEAWTENEPVFISEMIPGIDGMLGVATLADWDVRIDPATSKLTLYPAGKAPPLEGETVLPLTCGLVNPEASKDNPQGFRAVNLTVPLRVGPHELMAIPDTGKGGIINLSSTLMEKYAPEALKNAQLGLATGITLSGKAVTREARLPEITFGPDTLRGLNVDVIDAPPGSMVESRGLIGLNLLRHYVMTFRFAAGELRLKPLGTVQDLTRTSTAGIHMDPECKILSVVPDGPADKAGLRAGDEILEIEGLPLKTMTPEEFAAFKRLPPGSVVKVRYRRSELSPVEVHLVLVKE